MYLKKTAAAAAKSLQSCPTLCDPTDGRLPHPWDSPGKNTGVGCHFLLQCRKVKVKSLSRVRLSRPHELQPTRLLHPWDFPGKSTGVGCQTKTRNVLLRKEEKMLESNSDFYHHIVYEGKTVII